MPTYPPFTDPVLGPQQPLNTRWSYWPVSFQNGDLTVIGNASLPLSGVKLSHVMRGVGELSASLQLADPQVRALFPWDKVVPRKTGIVAVRASQDPVSGTWAANYGQFYRVLSAPTSPATGRMSIKARTVESVWSQRLITKAITWSSVDQIAMVADLLNPAVFSKIPLGPTPWTGWINVDPPTVMSGVLRDFTYTDDQETSLLAAHQDRSQLATNPYEWTTGIRVLSGTDLENASTYRVQYVTGFPQLGRQLGQVYPVPRLKYDVRGFGNVLSFEPANDASSVVNIVWGRGNGYDTAQVKTQVQLLDQFGASDWLSGTLQTEGRYSNPDVSDINTLNDQCYRTMYQSLSSQQYIGNVTLRGDIFPFFGSYVIGDQMILATNDQTWPPDHYGPDGFYEALVRVYGWTVTPPQGDNSETVELLLAAS